MNKIEIDFFWPALVILVVLFAGDPDLMGALIQHLIGTCEAKIAE